MRAIKITNVVRHLEDADQNVTRYRIREILSEHRANLITGILGDLQTYLQFKFYADVDREKREILKTRLVEFAATKVSLNRYSRIVAEIENSNSYRVPTLDFFNEIDAFLEELLNPAQLQLI